MRNPYHRKAVSPRPVLYLSLLVIANPARNLLSGWSKKTLDGPRPNVTGLAMLEWEL